MNPSFLEQFNQYRSSQTPALVCGGVILTYAQLYERSLALAARLRSLGVGMDSTSPERYDIFNPTAARHSPWVIVIASRSADAVVGAVAAWMAGGAFVLIEDTAPDAYVQGVIEDTGTAILIRNGVLCGGVLCGGAPCGGEREERFVSGVPKEDEIACAVFTSGSTGRAKGAVLEHRVFGEMLTWQTGYMNPAQMTATAAYAPFGFIAAIWELFFPLYNGLTLHILDEATRHDLFALERYIEKHQISYLFLPPNIAALFTETYQGTALKYLRVAGGRLNACGDPGGRYEIMYHLGMSENGGSVTFRPIDKAMNGVIPIGKAWNHTKLRLDGGEMIVSGPSLFRGYLARKDETERKRIGGEYHSGDLARMDETGALIHLGRRDFTIKIRDMKVNPTQVESALSECAGVSECCVTAQTSEGEAFLIAWFTGGAEESAIKTELSACLPEHMIPAVFVKRAQLPRNGNGKVDRQALRYTPPVREVAASSELRETEIPIARIFEQILALPAHSIGAEDHFLRLGGDSLKLMRLQGELARTFSANVSYRRLFENPTVRGVAEVLGSRAAYEPIPPAAPMEEYPLSAPMRQMWLLWRTGQDCGKYTVSAGCRVNGQLDRARVVAAFAELARRNAILRSRFLQRGGDVVQVIGEDIEIAICEQARHVFDLTKPPLFDITLTGSTLTFTTHHILADAAGLRVLMEDFWTLYGGGQPQASAQAHDITMWSLGTDCSEDESYWKQVFSDHRPAPPLPYDFARPRRLDSSLCERVSFDENETARLREYAASCGATVFQLFLAAYALLLSRLTGGDPVVGVPFSGREHPDTERTVGMLVRTLPVKLEVSGLRFDKALSHTRERFLAAWEHQRVSLERLEEIIDAPRTQSGNPFYDVMINHIPMPRPLPETDGLRPEGLRREYPGALFDLVLDLREEADGVSAGLTYAAALFLPETVRRWLGALKKLLLTHELDGICPCQAAAEREALPALDEALPQVGALLQVWKDMFDTKTVLPGDDFFRSGGTSLAAIRMEAALFEKGWLLSAADILQNPKLYEMAALVIPAEDIDWEEDA